MNKSFLKKLLTFYHISGIINNVKRSRQALYYFPPFLHIERLTGRLRNTSDGFDSRPVNSPTGVKRTKTNIERGIENGKKENGD